MYIMHVQKHLYKSAYTGVLYGLACTGVLYRSPVTGPMYNAYYVHKIEQPVQAFMYRRYVHNSTFFNENYVHVLQLV